MTVRLAYVLAGWLVAALLLLAWQLGAQSADQVYFSTFEDSAVALWHLATESTLRTDVLPSIARMAAGFALGSAFGILVGITIGYLRTLDPWVRPVLEFMRALPAPAILTVALLVLGPNAGMKVAVIAFGSCWPVLLNAVDGARNVDPLLIETGRVNRLGRWAILRRIVVPASLPQVFAGLRIALGIALVMMVISEMVAADSGLGYYILTAQRRFSVPETYGGVLLIGLLGWAFTVLFSMLERRAIGWHLGRTGGTDA
jgi:ABC-type nitrate/sulfonate/bicarbonate transport system permease component